MGGYDLYSKERKKIAYFYGCYTNTNEADVGKATVQVLEANGFEVTLPPQTCCGIPMLGNGDFKGARKMALSNVPSLLKTIRSGSEITFSSTSCGYMIKHEYSHLLSIPGAEELAPHIFDIFEFLRNLNESGNLNPQFKGNPSEGRLFCSMSFESPWGLVFPPLKSSGSSRAFNSTTSKQTVAEWAELLVLRKRSMRSLKKSARI